MKILRKLPTLAIPLVGASSVLFTSCGAIDGAMDKLKQPISNTSYNPLDKPGMRSRSSSPVGNANSSESLVNSNDHGFNNGDIVEVVIPNTALFAKVPKAGDRYKKVLKVGDSLRVIGGEKDFIQVVTENGDAGYVSSVMVVTQGFLTDTGPIDPDITVVGANETPIVPDVAPDPVVQGIGIPDATPSIAPVPVPSITAPVEVDPDPGLTVPEVSLPLAPAPVAPSLVPDLGPLVPDPTPVIPSLPDLPAPEPSSPGISE